MHDPSSTTTTTNTTFNNLLHHQPQTLKSTPQFEFPSLQIQQQNQQQQEQLRCPRCDSTNTKFCYYNNYNLSQPRHFCKSCRRYWTKGGSLRNIPVGGGSRKHNHSSSKRTTTTTNTATKRPNPGPKPEPTSAAVGGDLIMSSFVPSSSSMVGGFSSLLTSNNNGQFGNLLQGIGPGLGHESGSNSGSGQGLMMGELQSGWPDLAIFTPGSRFQ